MYAAVWVWMLIGQQDAGQQQRAERHDDEDPARDGHPAPAQRSLAERLVLCELRVVLVRHHPIALSAAPSSTRKLHADRSISVQSSRTRWWGARRLVGGALGLDLGAVAGPEGVEDALLVDALVGVRAEEVALALHEGGGQALRSASES